ncbi:uncharacterized protein DUF4239 [Roseiarcus fermentans]|uniref:Uncharacterized protein DUF4239 n=1 Tax=Roseiarcus fermentans TaxID=1473586 RepID=A0A366F327_9HYPH|nr:DUF4239 domain-containing protein [Roseiarcus fermentans]RBP08556.1 uncharacterized protein DUF4239 [Roseiarcus fermentans]
MPDLGTTALLFLGLCAAAAAGYLVKTRLPERHRSHESLELVQLTINLLVTFTAIVLGLLTTSVKGGFDRSYDGFSTLSGNLIQMDGCLSDYGPETAPMRASLRQYVAAVIATTWPDEKPPNGVSNLDLRGVPMVGESVTLGAILDEVGHRLRGLDPPDVRRQQLQRLCETQFGDLIKSRWAVIESVRPSFSAPFYWVLVLWLIILFASIGLTAPANPVSVIVIVLSAVSITVAVFVILDLDLPFGGLFGIPSEPMRHTLAELDAGGR